MENDYRRLLVVGITYNKVERGVYALILQELNSTRRLSIVIGMAEAQSIECKLQEIITPRPLTHDLITNMMRAFGLNLKYVVIKQLDNEIFAADLHISNAGRDIVIDARSSDGIALALRMGVPIYATNQLLQKMNPDYKEKRATGEKSEKGSGSSPKDVSQRLAEEEKVFWSHVENMPVEQLEEMLAQFVSDEAYEKAAKLRDIINKRTCSDESK